MILNWLIPILWIGSLYAQTNLEKGLIAYNRKAEGSIEDRAQPAAINEAIKYYQFALDEPDPIEMTIEVKVNGQVSIEWAYDANTNSVVFDPNSMYLYHFLTYNNYDMMIQHKI